MKIPYISKLFMLVLVLFCFDLMGMETLSETEEDVSASAFPDKYKDNVVVYATKVLEALGGLRDDDAIDSAGSFRTKFAAALNVSDNQKGKNDVNLPGFNKKKDLYQSTVRCIFDLAASYVGQAQGTDGNKEAFFGGMQTYIKDQLKGLAGDKDAFNGVIGEDGAGELFREKLYTDDNLNDLGQKFLRWYGFLWAQDSVKNATDWESGYAKDATLQGHAVAQEEKAGVIQRVFRGHMTRKKVKFEALKTEAEALNDLAESAGVNVTALSDALSGLDLNNFDAKKVEIEAAMNALLGDENAASQIIAKGEEELRAAAAAMKTSTQSVTALVEAIEKAEEEIPKANKDKVEALNKFKQDLTQEEQAALEEAKTKFETITKASGADEVNAIIDKLTALKDLKTEREEKIKQKEDDLENSAKTQRAEAEKKKSEARTQLAAVQTELAKKETEHREAEARLQKWRGKTKTSEQKGGEEEFPSPPSESAPDSPPAPPLPLTPPPSSSSTASSPSTSSDSSKIDAIATSMESRMIALKVDLPSGTNSVDEALIKVPRESINALGEVFPDRAGSVDEGALDVILDYIVNNPTDVDGLKEELSYIN